MRRLERFRVAKKWLGDGTRRGARGSVWRRQRRAGRGSRQVDGREAEATSFRLREVS